MWVLFAMCVPLQSLISTRLALGSARRQLANGLRMWARHKLMLLQAWGRTSGICHLSLAIVGESPARKYAPQ